MPRDACHFAGRAALTADDRGRLATRFGGTVGATDMSDFLTPQLCRSAALGALLGGFSWLCGLSGQAHAQRADAATGKPLPPIIIQNDGAVRATTESGPSRAQRRRAARVSRVRPTAAPAVAVTGPTSSLGLRDGIDGYVATATGVGSKTSTPILQLPRATSTVTRQEILERDAQSVQEALQYTAGVGSNFRQGNLTREYTLIRGFQGNQYLDGLRSHESNWAVEPYGLERIDVLKGPAATLYGQGSPGGLWDLTSKRPTDRAFGELLLRYGIRNTLEGAFDVGGPVTADRSLLYRVVGVGKIGNGEIEFSKNERAYLAPSFTFRPNEDTSLTVLASYQYDPHLTVLQPLPYAGTIVPAANGRFVPRDRFLGEPSYHDTSIETARIAYDFRHRINDVLAFQQNFAYQTYDIKLQEVTSRGTVVGGASIVRQLQRQDYKIDLYQVDNRLTADVDTGWLRHHALFGLDYSAAPNFQGTGVNRATQYLLNLDAPVYGRPLAANPITSFRDQDQRQLGVYAQDRVEIGRLSLQIGARADRASVNQKTRVLNVSTGVLSDPPATNQTDRAVTFNGGAIYNFDGGVAPYASYSQSFFPTSGADAGGRPFIPTTGEQKEAGVKYLPPGVNILMAAAVFDITQNNVLTIDLANPGFAVQTSSVRSRGAEFEVKTTHLHGLNLSAAYTYLDPRVVATNTIGGLGKHPVGIARNQASLWATYRFSDGGALGGLILGGGVRYVGVSSVDALNTLAVPAFTLFDATARYQIGALNQALAIWDVALNVKNLADTRYVGSCDDSLNCYYGAGRIWSATARARF